MNLKSGAESEFVKMYLLNTKNKAFLDDEFDNLQTNGKLT